MKKKLEKEYLLGRLMENVWVLQFGAGSLGYLVQIL
jgi:hypothetical protein